MPDINVFNSITIAETVQQSAGGTIDITVSDNINVSEAILENTLQVNLSVINLLTETMTANVSGTLKGLGAYDPTNQWVQLEGGNGNNHGELEYSDATLKTHSFSASFGFYFSGSADGLDFYWGCSSTCTARGVGGGYQVEFDWFNALIRIFFGSTQLTSVSWTNRSGASFIPAIVRVTYNAANTVIDISYNGVHVLSYTDSTVRSQPGNLYGWNAWCGGQSATMRVNNISVNDHSFSENIYVTESTTLSKVLSVNIADNITISENLQFTSAIPISSVVDSIAVSEFDTIRYTINLADNINVSEGQDTISQGVRNLIITDNIAVSENVPHALYFDGSSGSFVGDQIIVSNPGFDVREFTIAFWVSALTQRTSFSSGYNDFWNIKGVTSGSYALEIFGTGGNPQGQLVAVILSGFAGATQAAGGVNISNTGPHHVVVTASAINNSLCLYVDTILVASAGWFPSSQQIGTLTIGSRNGDIGRAVNAYIDQFRWFGNALNQDQVTNLGNQDTVPAGLLGEFLFDNTTGVDTSGNGLNGTFSGPGPAFVAPLYSPPTLPIAKIDHFQTSVNDNVQVSEFIGSDGIDYVFVSERITMNMPVKASVFDAIQVSDFIGYPNFDSVTIRENINIFVVPAFLQINLVDNIVVEAQTIFHNLVPNPSFEVDTNGWDLEGVFTRSSEQAFVGSFAVKQVSNGGFNNFGTHNDTNQGWVVTPNTVYTLSWYYKLTVNSGLAPIVQVNAGSEFGANLSGHTLGSHANFIRDTITFNSGANSRVYFRLFNNGGNVVGFYDAFQLELGSVANPYLDGSVPGNAWDGTPNFSASTSQQNSVSTQVNTPLSTNDSIQVSENIAIGVVTGSTAPSASPYQIPRGVALSGLEFSPGSVPGTESTNYFKPTDADIDYVASKGFNLVRIPFTWERIQANLNGSLDPIYLSYLDEIVAEAKLKGLKVALDMHNFGRRLIYSDGGITENFTDNPEANLIYPWSDYSANGSIVLRDYGESFFGTVNNPVSPATGYIVNFNMKFNSRDNFFGGEGLRVKTMKNSTTGNSFYELQADLADNTWTLSKSVGGVVSTLASGFKTWGTSATYALVIDVGQTTAGKINVTVDGIALYLNNSVNTDAAITHGLVTFFAEGVHVRIDTLVLNINGSTSGGGVNTFRVGDPQVPITSFADVWTKIAQHYINEPTVFIYDLMNEPYGMPVPTTPTTYNSTATVTLMNQAAINAIRSLGDVHYIAASTDNFSGFQNFTSQFGANPSWWYTDPSNKVLLEMHYYFDSDHSGSYTGPFNSSYFTRIPADILPGVQWAANHNITIFAGEYGIPEDSLWYPSLDQFLTILDTYFEWGTYWAAGSHYSSPTTLEPTGNYTIDRGQMPTLLRHLPVILPPEPPPPPIPPPLFPPGWREVHNNSNNTPTNWDTIRVSDSDATNDIAPTTWKTVRVSDPQEKPPS